MLNNLQVEHKEKILNYLLKCIILSAFLMSRAYYPSSFLIHKCCTHKSSFIIRGGVFKGILLNSKWNLIISCGICAPKIVTYSKLFLWFEMFIPQGGLIIALGYNFLLIFLSPGKKINFLAFQFSHGCTNKALRLFLRIVHMQTPTIF